MKKNRTLVLLGLIALVIVLIFVLKNEGIIGGGQQAAVITAVPANYWPLDGSLAPSVGSGDFPASGSYTLPATCTGGVGGCLDMTTSSALGSLDLTSTGSHCAVTVEFLMKAGPRFQTSKIFDTSSDNFSADFVFPATGLSRPEFYFRTKNSNNTVDVLRVGVTNGSTTDLSGINYANL